MKGLGWANLVQLLCYVTNRSGSGQVTNTLQHLVGCWNKRHLTCVVMANASPLGEHEENCSHVSTDQTLPQLWSHKKTTPIANQFCYSHVTTRRGHDDNAGNMRSSSSLNNATEHDLIDHFTHTYQHTYSTKRHLWPYLNCSDQSDCLILER